MNIKKICAALTAAVISVTAVAVTAFAVSDVTVNKDNFPDETFREYVSENFDKDKNGKLSQEEWVAVTEINVEQQKKIKSLKGVEKFKNLEILYCNNNKLTTLDVSENTKLKQLDCGENQLTKLDLSKNTELELLWCYTNRLTKLDVTQNTELKGLSCFGNKLTTLDVSNCDKDIYADCDDSVKVIKNDD